MSHVALAIGERNAEFQLNSVLFLLAFKGGLRRKNTPEKQKKTATKPQGQESRAGLLFEEMKKRT